MSNVRASLAISFAEKYSIFGIQFITSLVLARVLSPHEIGIFSIGAVLVSVSHTLRDLGITNYIIQEKELTLGRIRTAQAITLTIGWTLSLFVALAREPMAAFYGEPGVAEVLSVLALNFLVLPFGSITAALLRREMRFDSLLRVNLVGALAQSAVSIVLALSGSGFMSLAWGGVANALAVTLCTLFYRQPKQPWLPAFAEARRVLRSGSRFSGAALLGELGYGVSELLTGRALSLEAVGLLSRAMGTVTLLQRALVEGVYPVAIPLFAAKARSNEALGDLYIRALAFVTVLGWPSLGLLALVARPLIAILFGAQWDASVLPAQILCIGAAAAGSAVISGSVAVGLGDAKLVLRAQLLGQPAKIAFAAAGCTLGLAGVAAGLALGEIVIGIYYLIRMRGLLHLDLRSLGNAFGRSAVVAGGVVLVSMIPFRILKGSASDGEIVVACVSTGAIVWLGMVFAVRHPITTEIMRFVRYIR